MAIGRILRRAKAKEKIVDYSAVNSISESFCSYEEGKPFTPETLYMRASGFGWMCGREEALCSKHNHIRKGSIDSKLGITFQIGHSLHDMVQNKLGNELLGHWKCVSCNHMHGKDDELLKMPKVCEKCENDKFEYSEIYVYNEEYQIGGHPDGILDTSPDKSLFELKTINDNGFTSLSFNGPREGYLMQVNLYMWMLGLKKCYLVYLNKNTSEMKEFVLSPDEDMLSKAKLKARELIDALDNGTVPERTVCNKKSDFRAKSCSMAKLCFDGGAV